MYAIAAVDVLLREQIRGVAEVVHLRLLRNHLQRNMSVEGAVRQLRKHVTAFGGPAASVSTGHAAGTSERLAGGHVVIMYRHHAWMSRQYLTFGEASDRFGSWEGSACC